MRRLGPRAFVVTVEDRGDEVVYAESRDHARNCGMTEYPYIERKARRAPGLDQYMAQGGPTKANLLRHGWWFTCHWDGSGPGDGCTLQVDRTHGAAHGDGVYCWKHLAKVMGIDMSPVVDRFKAFIDDWLGMPATGDHLDWRYEDLERLSAKITEHFGVTIPVSRTEEEGINLADVVSLPVDQMVAYIAIQMHQRLRAELDPEPVCGVDNGFPGKAG